MKTLHHTILCYTIPYHTILILILYYTTQYNTMYILYWTGCLYDWKFLRVRQCQYNLNIGYDTFTNWVLIHIKTQGIAILVTAIFKACQTETFKCLSSPIWTTLFCTTFSFRGFPVNIVVSVTGILEFSAIWVSITFPVRAVTPMRNMSWFLAFYS